MIIVQSYHHINSESITQKGKLYTTKQLLILAEAYQMLIIAIQYAYLFFLHGHLTFAHGNKK